MSHHPVSVPDITSAQVASEPLADTDRWGALDATLAQLDARDWLIGTGTDGSAAVAARRRVLERQDREHEFDRAARSPDRRNVHVKLPGDAPAHRAAALRRIASMGIPAFRILLGGRSGALSPDTERLVDEFAAALGLTNDQRDRAAGALLGIASQARLEQTMSMGVVLVLSWRTAQAWRVPADIFAASPSSTGTALIARYDTREEWLQAIGLLPLSGGSLLRFSASLPFSRLASVTRTDADTPERGSRWLVTPDVATDTHLLRYLEEVLSLGYSVRCVLRTPQGAATAAATGELSVERVMPRARLGLRTSGIYLSALRPLDSSALISRHPSSLPALLVTSRVPFDRLFADKATHIVAPGSDGESRRSVHTLGSEHESQILKDIAVGGPYSKIPLGELKSPVYRFHLDVDLPWDLFEKWPAVLDFKRAQQAYLQGSDSEEYKRVAALLTDMYPSPPLRAKVSKRTRTRGGKDGHHVVFPDLLLPNDGRQGLIAAAQVDAAAAKALVRLGDISNLGRFLAQVILNDHRHLRPSSPTPLTYRVRNLALVIADGAVSAEDLTAACKAGIIFDLRDRSVTLSTAENETLVQFAVASMGAGQLSRYLARVKLAPTAQARRNAFHALAKRCRWEIVRRARYFDTAIYGVAIGLRLLGTAKWGNPHSQYLPSDGAQLSPTVITTHSVRAPKGTEPSRPSSAHAALLLRSGISPGRRALFASNLEGLLSRYRLRVVPDLHALEAEFSIAPKAEAPPSTKVFVRPIVDRLNGAAPPLVLPQGVALATDGLNGVRLLARYSLQEFRTDVPPHGRLHLYPPQQPVPGPRALPRRDTGAMDVVRVRVYIPAPIVDAPGNDFGGDSRGAQFEGGTSRFDGDFAINRATGEVVFRAHWGLTKEYDSTDTRAVEGKPSWWRDLVAGAAPVASDRLGLDESNVSAARVVNSDGSTTFVIGYEGANPLMALAPAIDGTIRVTFNVDGTMTVTAAHDGFPAHTVYVNGQLVHEHDPLTAGNDPTALFGTADIVATKHFGQVPPRLGGRELGNFNGPDNPPGGDQAHPPVDVVSNVDGSYTVTTPYGSEDFMYDPEAGGWVGDLDGFIGGDEDTFAGLPWLDFGEEMDALKDYLELALGLEDEEGHSWTEKYR